ncbi:MAG: V-type ATPase subunit [Campylobacterota bacterium]|nr:V-type ATPase subunit [Campylobacterota bacterium]
MPLGKAVEYGSLSARCHVIRSQLIDPETLRQLTASRSIGELASTLSATLYAPFITDTSAVGIHQGLSEAFEYQRNRVIRELNKRHREIFRLFFTTKYALLDEKTAMISTSDPEDVFRQIDRNYIALLKKSMLQIPPSERRQLKKIIGSYFDLLNLYNLVKSRLLYRQTIEETLSNMLPFAEKFTIGALAEFCNVQTLQQLSRAIEPVLGEKFNDYETFRYVLYRYHRKQLLSVWSGYPFSIALPFSLLRLIEIEISDLRAVTEGIAFGLNSKEIITMTVGN